MFFFKKKQKQKIRVALVSWPGSLPPWGGLKGEPNNTPRSCHNHKHLIPTISFLQEGNRKTQDSLEILFAIHHFYKSMEIGLSLPFS